jgi:16S rRNA (guanine527-N7)-methyltransferase
MSLFDLSDDDIQKAARSYVEEMAQKEEYRQQYDVAVSRAVASLNVLLEFDTPYIKIGGKCLLMKGDNVKSEIEESKNALSILNCKINNIYEYTYNVEDEIYTRYIVEVEKIKSTSNKYPRIFGKIKKEPLK